MMHALRERGYTAVEILVVVAVLAILTTFVATALIGMRNSQALKTSSEDALLAFRSARDMTLASKGGTSYGVAFESSQAVRFTGTTYATATATNRAYAFAPGVSATTSLSGSTSIVTFARLTGEASATGTITLTDTRTGASSTMLVGKTGLIERIQ